MTAEDLRAAVEEIGGLVPLLKGSDPTLRARFYEEVGLAGTYDPKKRVVDVEAGVLNGWCRRAITPLRTRFELA